MTDPKEHLTHWLRDAYAMESQAVSLLETQISRLETYPAARAKLQEHLAETCKRIQAEEEAMGDWIWQQMPTPTQEYLSRSEVGATAKR